MKKDISCSENPSAQKYRDLLHKYQLLSGLLEYVPDVIYFKDKKGRLIMVNNAHAKGLGLKPEDVVGKTDFDFFPRSRALLMARDDSYVMSTGKPIVDKIERATRPDGVDNYVSTTKVPRYDEKGRIIGLMGITRDITKRINLDRLQKEKFSADKRIKALEAINNMKSEFISVVSHELRTPLAIVKEAVTLVGDEVTGRINQRQKNLLLKAGNNIKRLNHLIDELLDISRIERGNVKLHYSLVNINDFLKDILEFFRRSAREKNISLRYDLPKRPVNIFIDADRINQVISNLVTNAIKFTEQGGRVTAELRDFDNKIRIGIFDTGIGISKQHILKLFNKFVQVSNNKKDERKGLGLGLSICKGLVDRHGGDIWAESKTGIGSRFYFTLPRARSVDLLGHELRDKINSMLNEGTTTYLINLLIVNYRYFKRNVSQDTQKLFYGFEGIIASAFKRIFKSRKTARCINIKNTDHGEYSILFSTADEKKAAEIGRMLKNGIKKYFEKNRIKGVFIDMAIIGYSQREGMLTETTQDTNLCAKTIFIGLEKRAAKRVIYRANIEIYPADSEPYASLALDISAGGMCFLSKKSLNTDSDIKIKLTLPNTKEGIYINGRIAWIGRAAQAQQPGAYNIGVKFIKIRPKDKKELYKFIKSVQARQKA